MLRRPEREAVAWSTARSEHLPHDRVEMLLRLVRVHDLPRARALPEHHRCDPLAGHSLPGFRCDGKRERHLGSRRVGGEHYRADLAARARFEGRDRPVERVGCRAETLERWCGHAVPHGRVYIGIRSVHTHVASPSRRLAAAKTPATTRLTVSTT